MWIQKNALLNLIFGCFLVLWDYEATGHIRLCSVDLLARYAFLISSQLFKWELFVLFDMFELAGSTTEYQLVIHSVHLIDR